MPTNPTAHETHTVAGVEIFALGLWTDSQGQEREWTESDLDRMLANFQIDSKVAQLPIKVGHVEDSFSELVADELGIPSSLLIGDEGAGAARLGYLANVRRDGSTLVADFEGVPNVITEMIKSGLYNAVSVEIDMPDDGDPHLSAVAILGAELPAVNTLASLDSASIFSTQKSWVTLSFKAGVAAQTPINQLPLEPEDNNLQEETMNYVLAPEDLPRLYEALGLPDTAGIEEVLMAVAAMKGEPALEEPMGLPMAEPVDDTSNIRIAALEAELNQLKGFNQSLQHERLVMTYAKHAAGWVTMSGTPEERGEELAEIHETAGKAIAEKVMKSYAMAHKAAADAGVLKSLGATHLLDAVKPDSFQDLIDEYAKMHDVSFPRALKEVSQMPAHQAEFNAYTRRVNLAVNGGK